MKIILDAMGGDNAPEAPVLGAVEAAKTYGIEIVLVGRGEDILAVLKKHGIDNLPEGMEISNADDVVDMHDDPASIIHKRKNSLIRPAVANVDQALVIFAMDNPKPNFMLLDRFLIMMEREGVPAVICFNKKDLATTEELEFLYETYQSCGYQVILSSALKGEGLDEIEKVLQGRTTVVAGPSGVGKSSLTNSLQEEVEMETGEISRKLKRGKHTTRHAQIIPVAQDTFLVDTPGFSSLYIENIIK